MDVCYSNKRPTTMCLAVENKCYQCCYVMSICCAVPYLKTKKGNKNVNKNPPQKTLVKKNTQNPVNNNISTYHTQNFIKIPLVILKIWQFKDNSCDFGFDCKINVALRSFALYGEIWRRKSSLIEPCHHNLTGFFRISMILH